jgi:hypothetical protein
MRVLAWLSDLMGGDRRTPERGRRVRIRPRGAGTESGGDMRGSYGFGRRAHRPDPKAHYRFDNDANRWAHPRG